MAAIADTDTFFAADRAAWCEWLAEHHGWATVVWLLIHKKHVGEPSVTYDEAVEEALRWGWNDGLTNRWDERSYAVRFTPRKPGSVWSESNVARVEKMIAEGRMTPAGQALVDEAKRRRTWAPTYRRQYIYWVLEAKRPETRARRVAETVRRTAAGLKPGERD